MKDKDKEKHIQLMQHIFYMDVYSYIKYEYRPKIHKLFTDSPISGNLVDLINDYFWGGNTVPYVAGQIADLLKSKYCRKK
jgi:hypothetical protein